MSSQPQATSLVVRFMDAFLQERNIKWVLAVGVLILLGSSLLLVMPHWNEYTPLWQDLIVLGYTAAIHGAGQWSYHRLGLRRTGTVLQGLTVLLIPILFVVIHWLPGQGVPGLVEQAMFMAIIAFGALASRQIFAFFLRSTQPTFLICYLLLSIAGTFLPALDPVWAPWAIAALWAIFAVGSMKVSRHIFWLTEEHRAPRVFGFFPIALLGAQFLFLYALHPALHFELDWIGLGCVLVAIPILGTADSVARVYQQRTGDLVRPLPWTIVLPVIVGLVLCAAGVVLSAEGLLPPSRPSYALVLASAAAGGLMALIARRTGKPAFVWAMLIGFTLAYNFSPMFFLNIVKELRDQGAMVVHESKLPFAFYGLTYLPLLSVLVIASRQAKRIGSDLFALPMQHFAFGLTCVLWALSMTHEKAMFPVGLCLALIAAVQVRVLRSWPAVVPALCAWISAAYGLPTFAANVLGYPALSHVEFGCLVAAAGGLLLASRFFDAWIGGLLPSDSGVLPQRRLVCRVASLALGLGLAAAWFVPGMPQANMTTGALVFGLLGIHALQWLHPSVSRVAIVFGQAVVARSLLAAGASPGELASQMTLILLGQWLLGSIAIKLVPERVASAVVGVSNQICTAWLGILAAGLYLPLFAAELVPALFMSTDVLVGTVAWPCRILMLLWTLDLARQSRHWAGPAFAYVFLLGCVGSAWITIAPAATNWLLEIWVSTGFLVLAATEWFDRRHKAGRALGFVADAQGFIATTNYLTVSLFEVIALGSLLAFEWPIRAAGMLSLLGLAVMARRHRPGEFRIPLEILLNLNVLWAVVRFVCPGAEWSERFAHSAESFDLALPLAAASAVSVLAWRFIALEGRAVWQDVAAVLQWGLRGLWVLGLAMSLSFFDLTFGNVVLAGAAFLVMAAAEIIAACQETWEERVWAGAAIVALGVFYMIHFHVVAFHSGLGIFAVLGIALVLGCMRRAIGPDSSMAVLRRPLDHLSFYLPLVSVAVGVSRHFLGDKMQWLGMNSLALLLAAAFYFWRGLEEKRTGLHLLAGFILNIALALLWRDLNWTDEQFYMVPIGLSVLVFVELLKREIPESFHNPLRYAGALAILVSPTLHIVHGSWVHVFCLMVASVFIALLAIGLRIRALLYTGTAFLLADLAAMLALQGLNNKNVLWFAGLALGAGIIALGAYCEKHRELLQSRMRLLASTLKTWE
jgi:hypothetical protein